ncbi:MAG TPA: pitrilysin family protein [Methylomirabilota bacterium]|jgi:zinc protease|nr:pitrilysin family protein [Methylomirabilota bacterium]
MPRRTGIVAAACATVLAAASPGSGQAPGPAPPGAAPGSPFATRVALPNGLVVLVAERPGIPMVSVRVVVEAGAAYDPADRAGLAALTARLLTRGSGARTAPEVDRAIEFVGGSLEAEAGRDAAELTLTVLRKDLELGLDLLADALLRPAFPDAELDRQREETRARIRRLEEDPAMVAAQALRRLAFPAHPYGRPVEGTEASLAAIGRDDVVAFHRTHYRPDRTVVAVAGDVTAADVRAALASRLGGWASPAPPPAVPGRAAVATPSRAEAIQRDLAQATIMLGQATVGRDHPDYYPLVVAAQLLGGGATSRLYTHVREERGLAYSVYALYAPARYGGYFRVELQCETARVREALALVRDELVRLRRERVDDGEVARARAFLVGSFPLRMSTAAEVTDLLAAIERFDLGLDYPARYRRAIGAVTADDVARAVRAHWDPDAMSLVVVGNVQDAGIGRP